MRKPTKSDTQCFKENEHKSLIKNLITINLLFFFFLWRNSLSRARAASFLRFLHHTQ